MSEAPSTTPPSLRTGVDGIARCAWVGSDTEYERYHDEEWGRQQRDPRALFEKVCLEGFQAGLSWITILRRRPGFREAFHGFEPAVLATYDDDDVERLMGDDRIIRNRQKIVATIGNARAYLALDDNFEDVVWSFAPREVRARPRRLGDVPAITAESTALSRHLKTLGFRFVGPTTMYALMQSVGMVDDHVAGCHRASVS